MSGVSPVWLPPWQGRFAEAEVPSRLLWGKTNKFEGTICNLKSDGFEAAEQDPSWGELFSKSYFESCECRGEPVPDSTNF